MLPFEFCQQSVSLFLKCNCFPYWSCLIKWGFFSPNFKDWESGLICYLIWSPSKEGPDYSEKSLSKLFTH